MRTQLAIAITGSATVLRVEIQKKYVASGARRIFGLYSCICGILEYIMNDDFIYM